MLMQPSPHSDPSFPCLSDALDPDCAGRAFTEVLTKAGFPLRDLHCIVERVRVKRGIKAVIGYRLTGTDTQDCSFDQRVMVALWPEGDPARLKPMGGALVQPVFGPSTAALEQIGGEAWFFPNDRKVHTIADLLKGPPNADGGVAEIVHYVPEQGCIVRHTHNRRTLFGKTRADDRGVVAAHVDQSACKMGTLPIRLAPVVHFDPARRILWQESVAGLALCPADVLTHPTLWARRVVAALEGFRGIKPLGEMKSLTSASMAQNLSTRSARTAQAMPELQNQIVGISLELVSTCPEPETLYLSHCDLHPGNLLWDGTSFALIDLDTAAFAPPARDYGSLIASLAHAAVLTGAPDRSIVTMVNAFSACAQDLPHIGWYVAASLIGERLYRCGTRLKSPSLEVRSRLIALARIILEEHRG